MSEHKAREKAQLEAEEQLVAEKAEIAQRKEKLLEAIEKSPDEVILRSEIIFGAISTGDGKYGIQCGEYSGALVKTVTYDLLFRSMMMFQHMEFTKAMQQKNDKRIITGGV